MIVALIAILTAFTVTSHKWGKTLTSTIVALGLIGCSTYLLTSPVWLAVINNSQVI
jgi:hypothetical protein